MVPDRITRLLNTAIAHQQRGELEAALAGFAAVIHMAPDVAEAHLNAGVILQELGRPAEALAAYDRALSLQPDVAWIHNNRALALHALGRPDEALNACDLALQLQHEFAEAHNTRGHVLAALGRQKDAVSDYACAIDMRPDYAQAHDNRLLQLHYCEQSAGGPIFSAAQKFGAQFNQPTACVSHPNTKISARPLRVGYMSGDLCHHPVGYFLQAVLPYHNRAEFEVHCYSTQARRDDLTDRLAAWVDGWTTIVGLDDAAAASRIRADSIDILIDLSGHTAGNRLQVFAQRPAPVQATWLGYSGTTGLAAMDYIIADRFVLPEIDEPYFTERVWRLPNSYLCFTPPDLVAKPELRKPKAGPLLFGSFNNLAKLSPQSVALYSDILKHVPDSQLLLKDRLLSQMKVRREVLKRFAAQGVDFGRIQLKGFMSRQEHFALYNRVDIVLDPIPYGGTTTTAEALWMGVPVVTLRGGSWVGRVGESILNTIGISELIANNVEGYIAIAKSLARDTEQRAWLKENLRTLMAESPFCDGQRFTRDLESTYRGMWRLWCQGANMI